MKKLIIILSTISISLIIGIGSAVSIYINGYITVEDDVIKLNKRVVCSESITVDTIICSAGAIIVENLYGGMHQNNIFPTANETLDILGWYEQTNNSESLTSINPITASISGYHSHYSINLSSVSDPFTLRATGTSIEESTGNLNIGDIEDLEITGNGYVQTSKSWITAPEFSIVEGSKSATIDIYRNSYWDHGNRDFTIDGIRMEWIPNVSNWDITIEILKVNNDGSLSHIDSTAFDNTDNPPRCEAGKTGKHKRLDYNTFVEGSANEGIILIVDQTGIKYIYLEIKYH